MKYFITDLNGHFFQECNGIPEELKRIEPVSMIAVGDNVTAFYDFDKLFFDDGTGEIMTEKEIRQNYEINVSEGFFNGSFDDYMQACMIPNGTIEPVYNYVSRLCLESFF